ncbi:MAG: CoA transferase, partial [Nocardioidaceae bacterium]
MPDPRLPLAGVRVLDVATVLAAPVAATLLGDFGADVVKVEEPRRGDFTRAGLGTDGSGTRSLQWVQEGRNKKSVTIDLRTPRGQQLLCELVPHFDVVVTNYRPPTLEKWGLEPERLQELNPRAVLVFLTGYGLT